MTPMRALDFGHIVLYIFGKGGRGTMGAILLRKVGGGRFTDFMHGNMKICVCISFFFVQFLPYHARSK